ncbi:peptidylprolyl isomerase, partial [Anaerolinea sp.]|uniref:peptidylprolyl isomerase n=1 Tax=Anaerolinea sp. TaxID=1872519 RepID=UPI002ACF0482
TLVLNIPKATPLPKTMDCVLVSVEPTPTPSSEPPLFPPPSAQDWTQGPENAVLTFIEYTDLQAPASLALDWALTRLRERYPEKVRRVFRHFPLPTNDKSLLAGAAAEAAGAQGKFWEMTHLLLERQEEWTPLPEAEFRAWLEARAADLALDVPTFLSALDDPAIRLSLQQAQEEGFRLGIPTMPFVLVNQRMYQGPRDYRSLETLLLLEDLKSRQFRQCPPFVIDPARTYVAVLETTQGELRIQLFADQAPQTVNNFVFLARQGWYDGVLFHRVLPGYIAQSGDPSGSGFGTPGYAFADELNALRFDQPGRVAMANAGPNSNGSQFFIAYTALPDLDGQYPIFGQVIEGLEVLNRLTPRDPSSPADLPEGDRILRVRILEAAP